MIACRGTVQGDVFILSSNNMRVHTPIKKAHIGVVTALAFSQDSRLHHLYLSLIFNYYTQ